ncbi:ABC transporter ATP-binding protein [Pseudorhodoferax sp.]|uniref:ABC transporter ATP-binding protein n=1 Tax=Pseudorhodoferax sp. TaxID=1993553 RepID=UPI002DD68956|nr:ABC transporter ATP-binding protein [Pseudorhodoferax sp.]
MSHPASRAGSTLELRDVTAWYGAVRVLHEVSLTVAAGGVTALLGANGAGKTTTLRAISNVLVTRRGEVALDGESIAGLPPHAIVRRGIAHVPDGRGTFVQLSVEDNLRLGGYTGRPAQTADSLARVFTLFPRLAERRRQQAGTLSGGEQQMLAIGRALMLQPRLILLDEPSFGLAPVVVQDIFQALRRIRENDGVSMLLVEQNVQLALDLADHACLLESGRVVRSGTADQIRNDDTVRRVYLGY